MAAFPKVKFHAATEYGSEIEMSVHNWSAPCRPGFPPKASKRHHGQYWPV